MGFVVGLGGSDGVRGGGGGTLYQQQHQHHEPQTMQDYRSQEEADLSGLSSSSRSKPFFRNQKGILSTNLH